MSRALMSGRCPGAQALGTATLSGWRFVINPEGFGSPRDWVCELANQLMGRVKNRLLGLGVEILLATPAGLTGENLSPAPGKLRAPQVFAAADGFVVVWIDCECAEGFELHTTPSSNFEVAIPEGESVLF
jgi:hypothetical protein